MDIATTLTNSLNYLDNNAAMVVTTLLTYLASGGGISAVIESLKKLRKWDRTSWILFVLGAFSLLSATADYIISNSSHGAIPQIFGDMAPKLVVAALFMHRIAVNPGSKAIEKWLQTRINKAAAKVAVQAINSQATVADPTAVTTSPARFPASEVDQFQL